MDTIVVFVEELIAQKEMSLRVHRLIVFIENTNMELIKTVSKIGAKG